MNIKIKDKIFKQIKKYCDLNKLNVNDYIESLIQKLVTADIYGEVPDFVKLSEQKKEEKEEKKSVKEIERLNIEIDLYETTVKQLNELVDKLNQKIQELENKPPVEVIKEVIVEKEIDVIKEVEKPIEQPLIYDFSQFISQTTTYEEEIPYKVINNKSKKRRLN